MRRWYIVDQKKRQCDGLWEREGCVEPWFGSKVERIAVLEQQSGQQSDQQSGTQKVAVVARWRASASLNDSVGAHIGEWEPATNSVQACGACGLVDKLLVQPSFSKKNSFKPPLGGGLFGLSVQDVHDGRLTLYFYTLEYLSQSTQCRCFVSLTGHVELSCPRRRPLSAFTLKGTDIRLRPIKSKETATTFLISMELPMDSY